MTHVRTSPYYPQSNGKLERWHQSVKRECIRPLAPLDLADARRLGDYVRRYNHERLHGALGYVTPADQLAGRAAQERNIRAGFQGGGDEPPGLRERQPTTAAQPLRFPTGPDTEPCVTITATIPETCPL